jgi:hypothetical protein
MNGHWFCSDCEQAVCLPTPAGRWSLKRGQTCPLCHKKMADWIDDTPPPVSVDEGKKLFQQMKDQL